MSTLTLSIPETVSSPDILIPTELPPPKPERFGCFNKKNLFIGLTVLGSFSLGYITGYAHQRKKSTTA